MPYNNDNFRRIAEEFQMKRRRAEDEADNRRYEAEHKIPELREIHLRLAANGSEIFGAALSGGDINAKIAQIKKENDILRQRKSELLRDAGFPEDFTEPHYECDICHDTGYHNSKMCKCFKEALVLAGIESSGLGKLVLTQSFDSFSLDYYTGNSKMAVSRYCKALRDFAEGFSDSTDTSWLLMGNTGLGKTHLSSAVAMTVIKRGFDVVYITAGSLFSVFERQRFGDGYSGDGTDEHFYDADLLIIDDLGTENVNQFTVSCLYNVINSRLVLGRSTIINTNLTREELRAKYADRITSRLFGEFIPLVFTGNDVRAQKLCK